MTGPQETPPHRLGIDHVTPLITTYFVNDRLVLGIKKPIILIDEEWIVEQERSDPDYNMLENLKFFRKLLAIEGIEEPMEAGPSYVSLRHSGEWEEYVLRESVIKVLGETLHWDPESIVPMSIRHFWGTAIVTDGSGEDTR